jgi:RNA polymerase Rpb5, N-terminal domain
MAVTDLEYKIFTRAYRTVLEMVRDRGYRLPTEDVDSLVEKITLEKFMSLR